MTNSAARPLRTIELILDAKASLGEGPLWSVNAGRLYWLDIHAPQIHRTDPADGSDRFVEIAGFPGSAGGFAIAWEHGFGAVALGDGAIEPWCVVIRKDGHQGWFDGMCIDAEGALWIGHWAVTA
ncbi:hypothetical protein LBMAG53_27720 [Planctomycetota bacterium]|nr:hypothetical protein LBMAG53_27720 [Planctomycetota bacterium]